MTGSLAEATTVSLEADSVLISLDTLGADACWDGGRGGELVNSFRERWMLINK